MLKIEEVCILYIYREYILCLQSNPSGSFLQKCINFVEQPLKFSHFEDSIVPWSNSQSKEIWNIPLCFFIFSITFERQQALRNDKNLWDHWCILL